MGHVNIQLTHIVYWREMSTHHMYNLNSIAGHKLPWTESSIKESNSVIYIT